MAIKKFYDDALRVNGLRDFRPNFKLIVGCFTTVTTDHGIDEDKREADIVSYL